MAYYGKRDWLVRIRKNKGLSQDMTAALSDISQTHYSKIENGFTDPSPEVVERVCKVIGITPEEFYSKDDIRINGD